MAKLIAVCGATGQLGGSIARRMLGEGWRVRAITRNVSGAAAKVLKDQGAEIVTADYDDVGSLEQAFAGAQVVFAVTQFWEYLFTLGQEGAGRKEYEQLLNIASAAAKLESLEHLILHTLLSGEKLKGKDYIVHHVDWKDKAADKIKESMPQLAQKTTFFWLGQFANNYWTRDAMKPFEIPGSYGAHALLLPVKPATKMFFAGDVEQNVGVWVHHIIANPSVSLPAKYVDCYTDAMSVQEFVQIWMKVTGKRATLVSATLEEYEAIFGLFGKEIGSQYKLHDAESDWTKAHRPNVVTGAELGVRDGDLVGLEEAFVRHKDLL